MGSLDRLRQQHRELRHLAKEIVASLDAERLARDFTAARLKLSAFIRKIGVHVVLEDRFVYERLIRHPDGAVATKAAAHRERVISLRTRVSEYAQLWLSSGFVDEGALPQFIDETKSILTLMSERFALEDEELYPLVDRICSPSGTWPLDLLAETPETRRAG